MNEKDNKQQEEQHNTIEITKANEAGALSVLSYTPS